MKRLLTILSIIVVLISGCGGGSQKSPDKSDALNQDTGKAVLVFMEYEHNFGKVSEGEKVAYIFNFENKGTSDLVILSAITTCGCTVPKYDRKPIPPGKDGKLELVFDTEGRTGIQVKTVTVRSNASEPVITLRITAVVESD
ncbi:MAG TPA: hypothetical protein DDY34_07680 [Bacteroidales bacterium]|nr:hypothetical protein [Bacteroidales bacterium]